jgi:hypothetical protein
MSLFWLYPLTFPVLHTSTSSSANCVQRVSLPKSFSLHHNKNHSIFPSCYPTKIGAWSKLHNQNWWIILFIP